ncbi:MAG: DNA-directed RNA polymerase subunit H [Candidatus Woesearchaeota archaeon]
MVKRRKTVKGSFVKDHFLVSKHQKLSEKEKKILLDQYSITDQDLPKIFANDPAIQDIDVKPGDIIKIFRKSPTAKETIFYRIVIQGP